MRELLKDINLRLAEIEQAFAVSDINHVTALAHSLKSAAATLGAVKFSQLCADLERCALGGDLPAASSLVEVLVQEARELPYRLEALAHSQLRVQLAADPPLGD